MICPSGSQNSGEHWIPRPSVSQWTPRRHQGPRASGQGSCRCAIRGEPPPARGAPRAPAEKPVAPCLGEEAMSGLWGGGLDWQCQLWGLLAPLAVGLCPLRVPSGADSTSGRGWFPSPVTQKTPRVLLEALCQRLWTEARSHCITVLQLHTHFQTFLSQITWKNLQRNEDTYDPWDSLLVAVLLVRSHLTIVWSRGFNLCLVVILLHKNKGI